MAKGRMAGDALRAKREKARERIAADPERAAERMGMIDTDEYDLSGYSDKEVIMAFQGDKFGVEDYMRLTGEEDREVSIPKTPKTDAEIGPGTETDGGSIGGDNTDSSTTTNTSTQTVTSGSGAEGAQDLLNGYVQSVAQDQDFSRSFGDNQNTNSGTVYGNLNQGNQDFSVNIGSQSVGQGSGSGSSSSGETNMNNMQIAAAYGALNENQYERSQAKFNPYAKAQGNIDATKKSTGVKESNRAANELYGGLRDLYRSQAVNYHTNLFGDYFNQTDYKPPKWNPPAAPSAINPDYD